MTWSPEQYVKFERQRTRPTRDLLAQVILDTRDEDPIWDLGCGPGNSTELLVERFGSDRITGVDSDAAMLAAFHAHQARDKGFGPSAGPRAAAILARLFEKENYRVESGASPWRLTQADRPLIAALADGVAAACAETELVDPHAISDWRAARRQAEVQIGHVDLFSWPA